MPAAVSENTSGAFFGMSPANRRCSERRAVGRPHPDGPDDKRKATLRRGGSKVGKGSKECSRGTARRREWLSGRNRRLTGPDAETGVPDDECQPFGASGRGRQHGREKPQGRTCTGPMRRASRCSPSGGSPFGGRPFGGSPFGGMAPTVRCTQGVRPTHHRGRADLTDPETAVAQVARNRNWRDRKSVV